MGRFAAAWAAFRQRDVKQGPVVTSVNVGQSVRNMDRFENQARDGYAKNVIVYRCINLIAQNAASIPFTLHRGGPQGDELEDHALLDLLNRPNPVQSQNEYFQAVYGYGLLAGNSFQVRTGPDAGPPQELWTLRPDRMEIIPGEGSIPRAYVYKVDNITKERFEVDRITGDSAVKQTRLWNPLDDFWGLSPLRPAAIKTDTHNAAGMHNLNLIKHGGNPSGAMIYKPVDAQGNSVSLTPEQRQAILSDLQARMEGERNAGRILLLVGDFDWQAFGINPKDMDWAGMEGMSAKDVAQAFDVPPQLVGVEGSLTFANYGQARLALWEDGIIPRMRRVLTDLREWLAPQWEGEDLWLDYDWNSIEALVERKAKLMEMAAAGTNAGLLQIDEGRELLGLEPLEDDLGKVVLVSAGKIPLGLDLPEDDGESEEEARALAGADVIELARLTYGDK